MIPGGFGSQTGSSSESLNEGLSVLVDTHQISFLSALAQCVVTSAVEASHLELLGLGRFVRIA